MPAVDLVGIGLNATDTIIQLDHYPERGAKGEYQAAQVLPGGQVATVTVACALWGLRTRYVGKLGDDDAAALHRREFARARVDAQLLTESGAPSLQSLILVDASGERTVLNRRDARLALQPSELHREQLDSARCLHIDGYDTAAATRAAGWAQSAGIPVVADLDETYAGIHALLPLIDYLIVSRDFPERLTGEADLHLALPAMHRQYNCRLAAATLGDSGVLAWDGQRFHHQPAFPVAVKDTTGAGDLFHAGFIYAMLQGWPLAQQLRFACAAAALNCTATGARGYIAPLQEIEDLMQTVDAPQHATLAGNSAD